MLIIAETNKLRILRVPSIWSLINWGISETDRIRTKYRV